MRESRFRRLVSISLLCASLSIAATGWAQAETSAHKWQRITEMLQREVEANRIPGAVVAVSHKGKLVYFDAVGQQDVDANRAMRKDAIFRIASMTKAITSVAVMQLIEQGKVSLDDPLQKYLPEFREQRVLATIDGDDTSTVKAARPVMIHDLLTHRSGLTYGWFGPEKLDAIYRANQIPDLFVPIEEPLSARVQRIAKVPLKFQPGTAWDYSVSTDVLGRVIEVVSGQSLEAYFQERIFDPLAMRDTGFQLPSDKEPRVASLYTVDDQEHIQRVGAEPIQSGFFKFSDNYHHSGKFFSGGGGLLASTGDYVRFLRMLLNGGELDGIRVLKAETVAMMTKNQIGEMTIPFPNHGDGFGLGFGVLTERGTKDDVASVGTISWGGIFNSYYWVDPQEQMVGVLMMQVYPNGHLATRSEFKRLAYEAIGRRLKSKVSLTRSAIDESAGDLECFRIDTENATYYLEKVGAGLSSMIDRDDNDWLSFHPKKGTGAAGEYRGFPNAVFKEAGSYFHPRNAGTDPCVCLVEEETPDRVVISATASNGRWAGKYTFTRDACTFTMTRMPEKKKFWVLYEGTPGGQYDDTDWWMTSAKPTKSPMTTDHDGDIAGAEWIAFGDKKLHRSLVLHHHEGDDSPDRFYQMQKKMTVFGFGRNGMRKYLDSVPQSFSIGFVESTEHAKIAKLVATAKTNTGSAATKLAALERFALTSSGDAKAGKQLFETKSTQCLSCHQVGDAGQKIGPNLSQIGGKFDRPHLIESLLYPSKQIGYGYETSMVVTADGKTHVGLIKEEDDSKLTLVDALDRHTVIPKDDIDVREVAKTSLMPSGLADSLSSQQFTDLVAYLETLRSGKKGFGAGVSGPIQLPPGFIAQTVATGLSGVTAFDIASDGRIFVCEQEGRLRVITKEGLLDQPFATVPVEMNWERGLIGVTLAPNFPDDPHVYVVYVAKEPYAHHRVSRFRADGNVAMPDSETVLLKGDDQSKFGGNVPAGHQGGGIHFGTDGKLYVGIGEQTAKTPSQRFDALQGKILRINPDGTIPSDNPFLSKTKGKYQSIWAIGCRNPFTFAVRKSTGDIFINDVGGKFEEINRGVAGSNYGWPGVDHGPTDQPGITGPIHIYPQASISGGSFADNATNWPKELQGKYFFADFNHGWVKWIDPDEPGKSHEFLSGIRRPVDIRFGPDGSLYVLLRNAWVVDDKFVGGTSSLMRIAYEGK